MAKFKRGDHVRVAGTHTYGAMLPKDTICIVLGTRAGVTKLIEYNSNRTWAWPASGVGLRLCKPNLAYMRVFEYNSARVDEIECEQILASNVEFFSSAA
jgi:hypothetical protein